MKVILLHNYKGGSGKSLFATNIARLLSNKYGQKSLLIEADFLMPSFIDIFDEKNPDIYFDDYILNDNIELKKCIYPNYDSNLGIIFSNNDFMNIEELNTKGYQHFFDQISRFKEDLVNFDYDFIILDLSPGFHYFVVNALLVATDILLILRPDNHSFQGIIHLLDHIYAKSIRVIDANVNIIFNQIIDHEDLRKQINSWKNILKFNYEFINKIYEFPFDETTFIQTCLGDYDLNNTSTENKIMKLIQKELLNSI